MPKPRIVTLLVALAAVLPSPARAHWARPQPTPVDRLVTNLGAYVAEHPKDAKGYFLLGRVHGLAFSLQTDEIGLWNRQTAEGLPVIPDRSFHHDDASSAAIFWEHDSTHTVPEPLAVDVAARHLVDSIAAFEQALALDDSRAEHHLGYAYILDRGAHLASQLAVAPALGAAPDEALATEARVMIQRVDFTFDDMAPKAQQWLVEHRREIVPVLLDYRAYSTRSIQRFVAELLERHWLEVAAEHYYQASAIGIKADRTIDEEPMRGLHSLVSYEAGKSYERLMQGLEDRRVRLTDEQEERLAVVRRNIAELDAKPKNYAITPIVLALDAARPLRDMIDHDAAVAFDLDGDGVVERWPWPKRGTGFLVWNGDGAERITSGRQLFGSATWWMLFDDGYAALDALDDDRDGWIRGDERRGLAVWFDRNTNGVSDDGEVCPLADLGIASFAVRATTTEDGCPAAPRGLVMDDGRVLPTYDWITAPVAEEPVSTPIAP